MVHADDAIPARTIASAFGVEMGPIIGTNILGQFLTTVDAPQARLILSGRDNPAARGQHFARLSGRVEEVPFALFGEHFMIARGRIGEDRDVNFFVDSGLAAFRSDQGQAGLLASTSTLESWGIPRAFRGPLR